MGQLSLRNFDSTTIQIGNLFTQVRIGVWLVVHWDGDNSNNCVTIRVIISSMSLFDRIGPSSVFHGIRLAIPTYSWEYTWWNGGAWRSRYYIWGWQHGHLSVVAPTRPMQLRPNWRSSDHFLRLMVTCLICFETQVCSCWATYFFRWWIVGWWVCSGVCWPEGPWLSLIWLFECWYSRTREHAHVCINSPCFHRSYCSAQNIFLI